ncbi:MAG TPA: hypothetical protein PLX08_02065 [Bacteroidales bacterium]|jgi:carbon monoxide dehydrogenase subunit G|nr:hypothetical protein [Bacteroidales bacterium]
MADNSTFESRKGKLTCTPSEIFDFVTDIRNLRQFIPENAGISAMNVEKESCSFRVESLGMVNVHISEKEPLNKIVFKGTLFQTNDFSLRMDIKDNPAGRAEVILKVSAELNPFLRMMVSGPVQRFLSLMIDEMEKFDGWNRINE